MKIFSYLKEDSAQIKRRLDSIVGNYSIWPQDRVFEETKKVLGSMKEHLEKESLLLHHIKAGNGMGSVLGEFGNLVKSIKSEIDNLVMIHVDEPGFEQGLESIDDQWKRFIQFCNKRFHPSVRQRISTEDMKRVNLELSHSVLS